MFFYKVASVGYESHNPVELIHEKEFTELQLTDMYISCMEDAIRKNYSDGIEDFDDVFIDMIHFDVVKDMISKYGFQKLQYTANFAAWQGLNADPDDWTSPEYCKEDLPTKTLKLALIEIAQKIKDEQSADN